jgi:hypothetical protein
LQQASKADLSSHAHFFDSNENTEEGSGLPMQKWVDFTMPTDKSR